MSTQATGRISYGEPHLWLLDVPYSGAFSARISDAPFLRLYAYGPDGQLVSTDDGQTEGTNLVLRAQVPGRYQIFVDVPDPARESEVVSYGLYSIWLGRLPAVPYPLTSNGESILNFDTARRWTLLFDQADVNQLWGYDAAANSWANIAPGATGARPTRSVGASASWDPDAGQLLLFGGWRGSLTNPQMFGLWGFTDREGWREIHSDNLGPTPRAGQSAVWSQSTKEMIIFGGELEVNGTTTNELWSYATGTNTWRRRGDGGSAPSQRYLHDAVWDSTNQRMLVFGGSTRTGTRQVARVLNDLWSYDPRSDVWSEMRPASRSPEPYFDSAAVWDSIAEQMLVYRGSTPGIADQIWSYRPAANTWVRMDASEPRPVPRRGASLVWDPLSGRVMLFGGQISGPGGYQNGLDDFWAYEPSANRWTEILP